MSIVPPGPEAAAEAAPANWIGRRLRAITADQMLFPLLILFAIYFVDEFDTAAFGVLAPEIKHAFHLTDKAFVGIVAANLNIVLLAAVPLGYYGDRLPRRLIVVIGAVAAGVFSLCTGLATGIAAFVLFRIGNGFGVLVNDPIHRSLLSDYYTAEVRPTVFATHANAVRWGAIFGSGTAGVLAYFFGWRAAFLVLFVPIAVLAFVATRLPVVTRGQSDDPDAAAVAAEERALPFGRAVRILWGVRTLRRQFIAWIFIGAAFLPLALYFPLYLDRVFHLNSLEVGVVVAIGNGFGLVGVQLAGRRTQQQLAKGLGEPLRYASYALAGVGPFLLIAAVAPVLPVALVGIMGAFFVGGMFAPGFYTVQALVSPARARSLSFGFGAVFLVLGLDIFVVFFGGVSDSSIRAVFVALVPFWIIGGLILASARGFVTDDTNKAFAVLAATVEMHRARREGSTSRSILSVRNLDVSYGPVQVLFGVNMELEEGEMIALLGTNGAGKSTLLKAISGLAPAQAGAIFFDGQDISGLEPEDTFAAGLVQVPGGRGIFPGLTVKENLDIAAWATRRGKAEAKRSIDEVLGTFPNLQRRLQQPAAVLSGGEQQMLTLGQAFIASPKLLMIDELSLGLAPIVVEELLNIVRRAHDEGVSVILVEQSVNVALTVADRAVFMEKGEVRFSGPTNDLLERDDILRAVFLGGAAQAEGMFS